MLRPLLLAVLLLGSLTQGRAQDFAGHTVVCHLGEFTLGSPLTDGQPYHYRWERSFDGGGSWSSVGTDSAALVIPNPTTGVAYRLAYAPTPICLADPTCANQTSATQLLVDVPTFSQGVRLCAGDTIRVGTDALTQGGNFRTVIQTTAGCDSVVLTFVELLPAYDELFFVDLCPGESFRGSIYAKDTTLTERFVSVLGCDSTVVYGISVGFGTEPVIVGAGPICNGETRELSVVGNYGSYAWNDGATTPSTIVSVPGTYALTVTNFTGCERVITATLTAVNLSVTDVELNDLRCPGGTDGSLVITTTGTDLLYSVDGGENFTPDAVFDRLPAGDYAVVVESPEGCRVGTSVRLDPAPPLGLTTPLPFPVVIERGDSIALPFAADFPVARWRWNNSAFLDCTDCPAPVARPLIDTRFVVEATAAGGCSVRDSVFVTVRDARRYYAPTAFSPNGDDSNDVWRLFPGPRTEAISDLKIADRWGGLRYEQPLGRRPPTDVGWDGDRAPVGTYVWSALLHYADGNSRFVRGQITLIR